MICLQRDGWWSCLESVRGQQFRLPGRSQTPVSYTHLDVYKRQGYSSLAYLKRFPIDKLKIDQSSVRDMLYAPADMAIGRAIVGLGHTLGLTGVAEGVEQKEQAGQLRQLGCDELQGYYFSRPLSALALAQWLSLIHI